MTVRFAGYAAWFDAVDRGGDIVRKGAFRDTLAAQRAGGRAIPLLWQHRSDTVVGRIDRAEEDERGLRVTGTLAGDSAAARALAQGTVRGLSFGYRVRGARGGGDGPRELVALELVEVSLVTFPMQPRARVIAVERAGEPIFMKE